MICDGTLKFHRLGGRGNVWKEYRGGMPMHDRFISYFPISSSCRPGSAQSKRKVVSGQCGGQDPRSESDAVAQQPDGHTRFKLPLNRAHHIQGGPSEDGHDGDAHAR